MKSILQILICFYLINPLVAQAPYEEACQKLRKVAYHDEFSFDVIDNHFNELVNHMNTIPEEVYQSCNCADSIWIAHLKDTRRHGRYTHSMHKDTGSYLRMLSSRLDIENLKQEFRFTQSKALLDSFDYVIDRMRQKDLIRHTPPLNWQNYYHCIEAENEFLKANKYTLKEKYFDLFDDENIDEEIRDRLITSYFYSNESIEADILNRIEFYIEEKYFYRMLGILRTSGTEKSVEYLTKMMRDHNFHINDSKAILQAIYGITDRHQIKKKIDNKFQEYLATTKLDTLSRYDLFIRKQK